MKILVINLTCFFYLFVNTLLSQINSQWVETDSLQYARNFHTSVKFNDGKVMLLGGTPDGGIYHGINGCEVYNPQTELWEEVSPMSVGRASHASIKLDDGNIFVCGGYNPDNSPFHMLNHCEVYSPDNDIWTEVDTMNIRRVEPKLVKLADGRILIIGGRAMYGSGGTTEEDATATCEIFDPVTGKIKMTASLDKARTGHAATLLPDGNVLVTGGNYWGGPPNNICEVFNPISEEWIFVAPMNAERYFNMIYLLETDKVLVIGGNSQFSEEYDYTQDEWTIDDSSNNLGLGLDKSVRMIDGNIFFTTSHDSLCRIFNPYNINWSNSGSLFFKQAFGTLDILNDGRILLAGGKNHSSQNNKAFLYYPDSTTSVSHETTIETFQLSQNYPNPFNPSTTIKFRLDESIHVKLSVYNLLGQEVSVLINEFRKTGVYEIKLLANNLPSGTYFYRLITGNNSSIKKMVLLR